MTKIVRDLKSGENLTEVVHTMETEVRSITIERSGLDGEGVSEKIADFFTHDFKKDY